jgi:Ion channel
MRASLLSRPAGHRTPGETAGAPRARIGLTARQDIALTAMLVLLGGLLFVVTPLAALGVGISRFLISLLVLAFSLLVILIARNQIAALIAWAGAGAIAIGAALVLLAPPSSASAIVAIHAATTTGMLICSYVIARVLFAPGPITLHRVIGAIVLYLNLGLAFATMYRLLCDILPGALQGIETGTSEMKTFSSLIYFSLVTLTSTGYGDVLPLHPVARSLTNLEAVLGQIYPATLIAAMVTQHLDWRHHR